MPYQSNKTSTKTRSMPAGDLNKIKSSNNIMS